MCRDLALAAVTGLALASGALKAEGPGCEPSEAAVAAVVEGLIAADNARDLDRVLASYSEDVLWLPPAGEPIAGKAAIEARYRQLFSTFELALSVEVAESRAAGSWAYVRGWTRGSLTPTGGGPAVAVDDKFLAVLACRAGRWAVARLMWSPRAAPAPAFEPITVVIVRHAEKAAEPEGDPPLTEAGRERAAELARRLGGSGVVALYASDRRRTQETLGPLAERLGLAPRIVPAADAAALAGEIGRHPGGVVVVAAHSNTIGPIIEALGGEPIPPIADGDFDDLFVVVVVAPGRARVLPLTYGAASP
jgi:uncharacterized protein (TIGR02246 family)